MELSLRNMFLNIREQIINFQTVLLVLTFLTVRILSFFIAPYFFLQNILSLLLVLLLIVLYIKKPEHAWKLVIAEIFLGGAGHFLEFYGLSIRTLFFIIYISLFIGQKIFSKEKHDEFFIPKNLSLSFVLFFLGIFWAGIQGIILDNNNRLIIQDLIPFAFFALFLPTQHMLKKQENQIFLFQLATAFIFGSFLFSLFTFILFSSGQALLQGPYYKWFRDIISGKLTHLGNGFWRVVSPEHLFLLPLTLIISSIIMLPSKLKFQKIFLWFLLTATLFTLTLNLSRGYFLALVIAAFPLLYKHSFKKWFATCTTIGIIIAVLFTGTFFLASHGKSFGLETFGLRIKSFTTPQIEESTYTRSALIKPIFQKISEHPILGSGFGSTVTFTNPVTKIPVTTNQFDWGYLELFTELGLIGFIFYLFFLSTITYSTLQSIKINTNHPDFIVGLLGGLTALFVSNLTAPALSHIFGVIFIAGIIAQERIFNKNTIKNSHEFQGIDK